MARKRILLVGADTIIGGRTLSQLLTYDDVSVRAVVGFQNQDQIHPLRQQYPANNYPWLEILVTPQKRLFTSDAFDDALRDHSEPFDTVIHVTADHSEEADCLSRFINVQTECLLNLLSSVHRVNERTDRVVIITSLSLFARWLVQPDPGSRNTYHSALHPSSEADPEYILATSQASDNIVYAAIKDWIHQNRVQFELVYVGAPSVYGPNMHSLENSSDIQEANRRIWNICSSGLHERVMTAPYGIDYYVDVRDLAFAIVQAAFIPQAGNRRFMISAGVMPTGDVIAQHLINRFPELAGRIRSDGSARQQILSDTPAAAVPLDAQTDGSILGLVQYRRVEETLDDVAQQILELQGRQNWRSIVQD